MQQQPHSPWHSPIPYLFGGLAAIYVGSHNEERDLEKAQDSIKACPVFEEKIVVIMAGDDNPILRRMKMRKNPNRTLMNNIKVWKKLGKPKHQALLLFLLIFVFCLTTSKKWSSRLSLSHTSNSSRSSWTRYWSKKSDKASCGLYGARSAKGGC
ncbi:hypothetical protein IFM89_029170 [Coptis chinensis]|uniref:Uncharacterized protein n=1 Tax=Coptis chinensis TaxID=261450 RepID=A0A835IMZ4_9MAGN|nr:hypothetical protein IFM89_029170 [Coptis chinensis]